MSEFDDVDAMARAYTALSEIPTLQRRDAALNWLVARLNSDREKIWAARHRLIREGGSLRDASAIETLQDADAIPAPSSTPGA